MTRLLLPRVDVSLLAEVSVFMDSKVVQFTPPKIRMDRLQSSKPIYRMAKKKKDSAEITLYGIVGQSFWSDGVSASKFRDDLKALGEVKDISLRINSEGGDVFEGLTMYNLLVDHGAKITVHVDGLAASIASVIAMAGDEIRMGEGSFMMIHNPWGGAVGDANAMRRMADLLDKVKDQVANIYVARTKNSKNKVSTWMDDETWMNAEESKKKGFAEVVEERIAAAASVSKPDWYNNLPSELRPNRAAAMKLRAKTAALLTPGQKK